MTRCAVRWSSGAQCATEATHLVTGGCVHEHISANTACEKHAERLTGGLVSCARCFEGRDPHECRVLARAVPLADRGGDLTAHRKIHIGKTR